MRGGVTALDGVVVNPWRDDLSRNLKDGKKAATGGVREELSQERVAGTLRVKALRQE